MLKFLGKLLLISVIGFSAGFMVGEARADEATRANNFCAVAGVMALVVIDYKADGMTIDEVRSEVAATVLVMTAWFPVLDQIIAGVYEIDAAPIVTDKARRLFLNEYIKACVADLLGTET